MEIFRNFAINIVYGYTAKRFKRYPKSLYCKIIKNNVYLFKPRIYYLEGAFMGVFNTWKWLRDVEIKIRLICDKLSHFILHLFSVFNDFT